MRKENPDKGFSFTSEYAACPNVKLTTIQKIVKALENMDYKITVAEDIRIQARSAFNKMFEI